MKLLNFIFIIKLLTQSNLFKLILFNLNFSYFPIEATKEMLLEFRPLMCPTDATKVNAAFYLSLFLPTKTERGKESQTYM